MSLLKFWSLLNIGSTLVLATQAENTIGMCHVVIEMIQFDMNKSELLVPLFMRDSSPNLGELQLKNLHRDCYFDNAV